MKILKLLSLLFFIFLISCQRNVDDEKTQLNTYRVEKLNEIIEYKYLLSQSGHVGWEYINSQPKIDDKPLIDSLEQYSNEIDNYLKTSVTKDQQIYRFELLLEIILTSKKHKDVLNQKVDLFFRLFMKFDKQQETFQNMLSFLSSLGSEKFKHKNSIEYCLNKLDEGRRNYKGRTFGYHFNAYIFYLSKVCKNDENIKKRLEKILEKKNFFDDETIKQQFEEF